MRFAKIKWNGKEVNIGWVENRAGVEVEHLLKSFQSPAPDMTTAFQSFIPLVLELLDLPTSWETQMRVTGLSINEEDDGRSGLVITSIKQVKMANAPLVLNTPHLREPTKSEEYGAVGFFLEGMDEAVSAAAAAAKEYLDGKREQRDIFDEEKPAENTAQLKLVDD